MVDTVFTEATSTVKGTVVHAPWLNDANTATYNHLSAVAGTNNITATGPLSMSAYVTGQKFFFLPAITNTSNTFINISAIGSVQITKYGSTVLVAGDLIAGVEAQIVYDGTRFQLVNPQTFNILNTVPAANITGQVAIANGGTGQTTANAAFNALSANVTLSFRNKLINAQGVFNQRGYVSGTATIGANQYTLDRWRVVTTGQSLVFSSSSGVTTMTAPAGGVEQVIEGNNLLTGVYTLSWTGTATATVNGVAITNGGQTASLTGGAIATVRFIGGTFSLPQLEFGTLATPFEARPMQIELGLCQRYFYAVVLGNASMGIGMVYWFATTQAVGYISFPVTMRVAPSAAFINFGTWVALASAGNINLGNVTNLTASQYGIELFWTATATTTAGTTGVGRAGTAGNTMQFNAEL